MFKKIAWALAGLFVLIQLIRPDQKNPVIDSSVDFQNVANPPTEVLAIMKDACYDCHSFETKYPWYSKIAPVSWWLANHIAEGREHLNFSEFGKLGGEDLAEIMEEVPETVQEGEMPLPSYTWAGLHPKANLSSTQRNVLIQWFKANGSGERAGDRGEEGKGKAID
ncbi:MAG: heme-binding domain-containing protein [Saprospiraceae bacterium]|nr:heme-binding domain-containing protein [Saprospiraceae bacterium]